MFAGYIVCKQFLSAANARPKAATVAMLLSSAATLATRISSEKNSLILLDLAQKSS